MRFCLAEFLVITTESFTYDGIEESAGLSNIINLCFSVWLIALVSVAVISMLSLVGVVILPLMRHKSSFNRLLSLLIALGVGTLVGDALMHLLPHVSDGLLALLFCL